MPCSLIAESKSDNGLSVAKIQPETISSTSPPKTFSGMLVATQMRAGFHLARANQGWDCQSTKAKLEVIPASTSDQHNDGPLPGLAV